MSRFFTALNSEFKTEWNRQQKAHMQLIHTYTHIGWAWFGLAVHVCIVFFVVWRGSSIVCRSVFVLLGQRHEIAYKSTYRYWNGSYGWLLHGVLFCLYFTFWAREKRVNERANKNGIIAVLLLPSDTFRNWKWHDSRVWVMRLRNSSNEFGTNSMPTNGVRGKS